VYHEFIILKTSNSISSSEVPQGLRSEARKPNEGQRPTDVKKAGVPGVPIFVPKTQLENGFKKYHHKINQE